MQVSLYQTVGARDSIRQRMQETLYRTADAGVSISDSGCKRLFNRQQMQETLYNRQQMQETLYQTADARYSI